MSTSERRLWHGMLARSWEPRRWFEDHDAPAGNELRGSTEVKIMWVYKPIVGSSTSGTCWQVGYYTPEGVWTEDETFPSREGAVRRVHYLNGGSESPSPQGRGNGGN